MDSGQLKRIKEVAAMADALEREISQLKAALDEIANANNLTIAFGESAFVSERLPRDPERHLKLVSGDQGIVDLHEEFRGMILELVSRRLNEKVQQFKDLEV